MRFPSTLHRPPNGWILMWVVCSILPLIPFTIPLLKDTVGNTPLAYLTWIPIMAFFWGGWNLYRIPFSQNVSKISTLASLSMLLGASLLLVIEREQDWVLLFWPVWSIGLVWLIFGFGAAKVVLRPMVYLLLVCPPIYLKIVGTVSPTLEKIAMTIVRSYSDSVSWLKLDVIPGGVGVKTSTQWVLVHITTACSGADSILAIIILFPVMLVVFKASLIRKMILVIAGSLLAVVANIARILIIITALHFYGISFALNILHPVLGAILFFLMIALLLAFCSRQFLLNRDTAKVMLQGPSKWRFTFVIVFVVVLTALLSPLYHWPA
jgi:exosortase